MNFKAYLAGILTGALCTLSGFLLSHSNVAVAAPGEANSNGYIVATPPSGANEQLIYVWDSTDPSKPRLSVYGLTAGKELQLRAHRLCEWDKKFDHYEMGTRPDSPEDMKKRFDAARPK